MRQIHLMDTSWCNIRFQLTPAGKKGIIKKVQNRTGGKITELTEKKIPGENFQKSGVRIYNCGKAHGIKVGAYLK